MTCNNNSHLRSMSNEETPILSFIKLSEQEIQAKTGIFSNPKTGSIWELYINDGKLLVEVPHFNFQIAPSSRTKFKPVNSLINLEFEFDNNSYRNPLLMHIYAKGIRRATFEALTVVNGTKFPD